jgi:hypothetical protein
MTELERFNKVWNGHFQAATKVPNVKGYTRRGYQTKTRYENILFSIWKHHPDWDLRNGFQIKCQDRAIYRVIELAISAGLLIKVKNYSTGKHTRLFHKNHSLFDAIFRNEKNKYGSWLNQDNKNNSKYYIIHELMLNNVRLSKDINMPYLDTKTVIKSRVYKKLNYDLTKLHILCKTMLPRYYKLWEKMNAAAVDKDLMFRSWLKFDNRELPTGRPYSYFCSTLNRKKKHKVFDPSMEYRDEFLTRVGLSDYYEVYDIKSEIPRINWLFHTGEWKDDNYDFYAEIIKDTEFIKYLDWQLDRGETKYTEYEDSMKQIFMRIYFGKGSDKQSYNGYLNNKLDRLGDDWMNYWIQQDEGFELNLDLWKVICDSVRKFCGVPIGNLIFWYAFFLETEVKIELLRSGKKVFNVYDGFYYNEDISKEIREILDTKSRYIYNEYMKVIKI